MAYCSVEDIRRILPETVTIGDQNIGTPVPGRGPAGKDNFTALEIERYIDYAQQQIDSRLRPFYSTPLRRIKTYETELELGVIAGSDVNISVRDSGAFLPGALVRLQDKVDLELATVKSVTNLTTIVLNSVENNYSFDGLISIVEFPDPVNIMTTRLTVSYLFDRLFNAEQSPAMSSYGISQRNQARNDLGSILTGEILLFGQEHTGRRFVRGALLDAFSSPAEVNKTEENE